MLAEGTAVAFTSVIERSARSFLITAVLSGEVLTIRAGHTGGLRVAQGIPVILSVVSTFIFRCVVQSTKVLAFCLIFTVTSK